jgi:hypothetical protein
MELRDMLDVVHYFFEEDSRYRSAEEAEGISAVRSALYNMYGMTYKYGVKANTRPSSGDSFYSDPDEVKPFIPPTQFDPESSNPFGAVLDAPIG